MLLKVMASGRVEAQLHHSLEQQERVLDELLDTQATAAQLVRDLMGTEEKVAHQLLAKEEELQHCLQRVQALEADAQAATEEGTRLQASMAALCMELEQLREEMQRLDQDVQEDASAVPPATYTAQLYYKISRIDWDYECGPVQVKGIHYGPAIAQPISIDSSQHSRSFVADYLWSLVDTAWAGTGVGRAGGHSAPQGLPLASASGSG
ncbi:kinetochore protein Spc24 [Alligator mississippiensis]|uniref:Kinetochore protein Spc24 n=1 Tax=Alligator mississippiensis TaxID=8496 RepID=A0A151NKZ7_ALLMI|nr:kinetochore protein Spc24 [Alligator mississippiensis]